MQVGQVRLSTSFRPVLLACVSTILLMRTAAAQLPGDANCDGRLDQSDLPALFETINGPIECSDADANQDGAINAADVSALLQLLRPIADGPTVTVVGIASAAGDPIEATGFTEDGIPIFTRSVGVGFKLVVEGAAGRNGRPVGRVVEPSTGRPDLQLETDQRLGNGGFDRCPGFVQAIDPPDFGRGTAIDQALRALACGFQVSSARTTACTLDRFGNINWVAGATQTQFCLQIEALRQFPSGYTHLTVQLLDSDGNPGPAQSIVVLVGNPPPATATRTRTASPTMTPTRTPSVTPSITPTSPPSATASRTSTAVASATPTNSPPIGSPTVTSGSVSPTPTTTGPPGPSATITRTRTASPTNTLTATPSRTGTFMVGATLTATRTPTTTRSFTAPPTATASETRTTALPPSVTRTRTRTTSPTVTPTPSRTRTPTRTSSPTPAEGAGPIITFFGLTNADDSVAKPIGTTPQGIPIYDRRFGFGFSLVVEAKAGASRKAVGKSVYAPDDPTGRPDLQIEVNRALGDGSSEVCDNTLPMVGGIPAFDPPTFDASQAVSDALNDLGCRFVNGTGAPGSRGPNDACTTFSDGSFHFVNSTSTTQYCAQIGRLFAFVSGDTLVTVRVRDIGGNLGPPAQILVRTS